MSRLTPEQMQKAIEAAKDGEAAGWPILADRAVLDLADALDAERKARREAEADARTLAEFVDLLRFKSCPCGRDLSAKESEATVRSLARAAGEGKAEPKPEPRDPRACPTCGSLSTFNGACMKCHEDYAMGGG